MSETIPALGTLTDRVQLQRKVTSDESEGGTPAVFTPLATVWARVRQLSVRPLGDGDARGQTITHSVVIRFRTDLRPGDRAMYRGRALELVATSDLNGRRAYLSCQCSERAVAG
ncbi:MAG: phage head closure protein [Devosia sp.]